MIRVAYIIDTIESPTAGTEKQLLMLIKHLDRSKIQPFLCVLRISDWLENEFTDCGLIDIGFHSFGNPYSYLNMLKFSSWLRKQNIDIVQTHFTEGNKVGVLAAKLAGVNTIISTRRNQGYWHNRSEIFILKLINKWVTCFLANSENTRLWAANAEGVDPRRIRVIYNSLEIDRFFKASEIEQSVFRKELGFPCNAVIVGIVANLRPVKAIHHFIKASKIVSETSPEARFVIVGDGPEMGHLESLCSELGMKSLVRFLGKRTDIPEILGCIDIGVLSSESESFSNSIVEYMASGLAVVCTAVGGAREAIEDGVNGYVVDPGDILVMAERLNCIIEKRQYFNMGSAGREKAFQMFSHKDVFERYQKLYEEMA